MALVVIAFLNLAYSNRSASILPSRQQDEVEFLEERLRPIRYALMEARYPNGAPIGYITADISSSGQASEDDGKRWAQSRYVLVPWNLVLATMDARYVIVDIWKSEGRFQVPAGFTKVYESPDGLTLLVRTAQ